MDEEELRIWLAKQLKRDPVQDPVMVALWDDVVAHGHVKEAKKVGEKGESELLEAAKALLPHAELMAGPAKKSRRGRKEPPSPTLRLTGYEEKRARALGEFLALRASAHPLVQRFREENLGGGLVSSEQARALIDSPAASRFPTDWFRDRGIPIVGHSAWFHEHGAVIDEDDPDMFIEFEHIFVDPPGKLFFAELPVSLGYDDLEYLSYADEGGIRRANHSSALWRDEEYVHVPVYPGSVLDDLRQLSHKLAGEPRSDQPFPPFPAWEEAQAALFVLTGEAVAPSALTAQYDSHTSEHLTHGTITLTIEPWVPTKTIVKVYQYLQRYMLARKPRAPSRRNLDVFSFVMRQVRVSLIDEESRAKSPERFTWRELMERWNQADPDRRYTSESQFSRDFRRGGNAVVSPYDDYELGSPALKVTIP